MLYLQNTWYSWLKRSKNRRFWPKMAQNGHFGPEIETFAKDMHAIPQWKASFTLKLNTLTIYHNFQNSAISKSEKRL